MTAAALAWAGLAGAASASAAPTSDAPTRAVPATGLTWHSLHTINGWQSAASYGTGNPAWAVSKGVVYLSGSVGQGVLSNNVYFANLPRPARPSRVVIVPTYTYSDTSGWLEIYPNGAMYANSTLFSNAQSFTSLAGISFPASFTTRHKLTLLNGWKFTAGGPVEAVPAYSISHGVVHLSGSLRQRTGTKETFAVLPPAARPAHIEYITITTYRGVPGVLRIYPSGRAMAYAGRARTYAFLDGAAYPQASASRTALTLLNGWESARPIYRTGDPAYWVSGGVVHLSGSLRQPSIGNEEFAVLPTWARPGHDLYLEVYTFEGTVGTLYIQPNGIMQVYSPTTSDATSYTSLATASFPIGS
jgi:hypothetical protein